MPKAPKTEIIATLGPASGNYTTLRKMFTAGLDVVRLNFSHGSAEQHLGNVELVRRLNKKYRRHIRIMQDLAGFRIRVGRFEGTNSRLLKERTVVWLTNNPQNTGPRKIPFDYDGDLSCIKPKQLIYIDDGNLVLRVVDNFDNSIKAKVVEGGLLKERKGINMPGVELAFECMTEKDKKDIEFAIAHELDYVALSFVRSAADVIEAAEILKPRVPKCAIVAKIESR